MRVTIHYLPKPQVIIPSVIVISCLVVWFSYFIYEDVANFFVPEITMDHLVRDSDLVIISTLNSQRTEYTWNTSFPARSITNVGVLEILKGEYSNLDIDILSYADGITFRDGFVTKVTIGGTYLVEYVPDKKMILFLSYDTDDIIGEGYSVYGDAQGAFVIDGDYAISIFPERNTTVQEIRDRLA